MPRLTRLAVVLVFFSLTGCGGGPMLAEPAVTQSDVSSARQALSTHRLEPSRNLSSHDGQSTALRVWARLQGPLIQTCMQLFSSGCHESVNAMKVRQVPDDSVNAYADAKTFTIGMHRGLMRSAGSDDEVAWVLAHEAAHLLFGHAQKKASNAAGSGVLGAIAMGAIGIAVHQPGMDTGYIGDMTQSGFEAGYVAGYLAYSPEMELEADQFAAYVMKKAGYRVNAALDTIVRLHRGDVPAPVRRGDGWAGYLDTHPANDYRLAAMQATIDGIRRGATRPLSKQEAAQRAWEKQQEEARRKRQEELQRLTGEARQQAAEDLRMCEKLREEYPKCDWFQGKFFDWSYLTDCPSQFQEDTQSAIRGCRG